MKGLRRKIHEAAVEGIEAAEVASQPLNDLLVCQPCKRQWPNDTEQAACIRLFGMCIVCRIEEIRDNEKILLGTAEILEEQKCYNEAH